MTPTESTVVRVEVYRCTSCPRTTVYELREGEHVENARCIIHETPAVLVGSWPVATDGERKLIGFGWSRAGLVSDA